MYKFGLEHEPFTSILTPPFFPFFFPFLSYSAIILPLPYKSLPHQKLFKETCLTQSVTMDSDTVYFITGANRGKSSFLQFT